LNKLLEQKKFNISKIILLLIFLLAVFLRAKVYFANSSLWLDECSLAVNILHNKFFGLLEYRQSAPVGFLLLTKLATLILGISEATLRFLPFLASILSVVGFYYLSSIFLKKNYSIVFANFLFAVNYYLIYYSQELKPYSSDVLVSILLLLFASKLNFQKISTKQLWTLGLVACAAFFVSFTSIFVSAGIFILFLLKNPREYKKLLALFGSFGLVLLGYYAFNVSGNMDYLSNYSLWQQGFISLNFSNFLGVVVGNINYFFEPNKFVLFALILLISGIIVTFKESKENTLLLTFPILVLIVASYLHIYPFQQRIVLFLIPILLLLISKPLDICAFSKKTVSILIIFLSSVYFLGYFSLPYYASIGSKDFFKQTDARGLTMELSKMSHSEDIIVLAPSSSSPFEVYSKIYPVKYSQKFVGQMPKYDKQIFFNALSELPRGKHYWFYIAHDVSHAPVRGFIEEWTNSECSKVKEYAKDQSYLIYAERN